MEPKDASSILATSTIFMFRQRVFLISIFFVVSYVNPTFAGEKSSHQILHEGKRRSYLIYLPEQYQKNQPMPVIVAFHGGGGNSRIMRDHYHFIEMAEREGFIVVFPNGASRFGGKLATWNAGACCGYAVQSQSDDVGFIRKMLTEIKQTYNVDENRIYAAGMSNGGMFSYRLACELTEEFAAVASVAGTENVDKCQPARAISIMHIHAQDDGHVLFEGGCGPDCGTEVDYISVPKTIRRWAERNECQEGPQRVLVKEGVYCDLYQACKDGVEIKLCVTEEGGHSWPGGEKFRRRADRPTQVLNATDEIWKFFEKFSK